MAPTFWQEQRIIIRSVKSDLIALGMTPPNPKQFVQCLNPYDCSKVSDGASSFLILSEEGLKNCSINKNDVVEIEAEDNIN
jgi:acetyl-CoA C-acetyltransferase